MGMGHKKEVGVDLISLALDPNGRGLKKKEGIK